MLAFFFFFIYIFKSWSINTLLVIIIQYISDFLLLYFPFEKNAIKSCRSLSLIWLFYWLALRHPICSDNTINTVCFWAVENNKMSWKVLHCAQTEEQEVTSPAREKITCVSLSVCWLYALASSFDFVNQIGCESPQGPQTSKCVSLTSSPKRPL